MPVYKGATMSWDTFNRMTAFEVENALRDELQAAMREYYGFSNSEKTRESIRQKCLPIGNRHLVVQYKRRSGKTMMEESIRNFTPWGHYE